MIKPARGYLLIEPDKAEEKTASGIILPETAQQQNGEGTIIAIGLPITNNTIVQATKNGMIDFSPDYKEGDKVIYKKWGIDEIKHKDKTYKLIKFEDIMGVIE